MTNPMDDLFGSMGGGGAFPKAEELEGKLLLLKPSIIEMKPKYKKPDELAPRATADTVVFEDDGSYEEYEDMFWSQTAITAACKRALKPGAKPYILGRLAKLPTTEMKKKGVETAGELADLRADWLKKGAKGDEPGFFWGFEDFSDADKALAAKYVADKSPIGAGAE
jgi:hypothetical protein